MHPQKPPRTDSSVMKPQAPRHLSRPTRPAAIGHPAAPYRRIFAVDPLAGVQSARRAELPITRGLSFTRGSAITSRHLPTRVCAVFEAGGTITCGGRPGWPSPDPLGQGDSDHGRSTTNCGNVELIGRLAQPACSGWVISPY